MPHSDDQPSDGGLPIEFEVYFPIFPTLNYGRLAQFIDQCEPDAGEKADVAPVENDDTNEPGVRIVGFVVSLGDMNVGVVMQSAPTPNMELIRLGAVTDEVKQVLVAHQACAVLSLVGGEDEAPIERLLFAYKVAAGLCLQGALGVGNVHTERVLPAEMLHELFGMPPANDEQSVWESLRIYGEPPQLLMSIELIEIKNRQYLATCGLGYCDLPDLAWAFTNDDEANNVIELFNNCFAHMMEQNIAFQAGETIEDDNEKTYRFDDPPDDWELPFPSEGVLVMTTL